MPLNKEALKNDLKEMFASRPQNDDQAAEKLATIIIKHIKTATVSTTVTGTCATPAGEGTIVGSGTGSLS